MITYVDGIRCYKLESGLYASVSACLDLLSQKNFLPDAVYLDRGTRLHKLTTDCLDQMPVDLNSEGSSPEEFEGYVQPALEWFWRHDAKIIGVERKALNKAYRMAGRIDVVCELYIDGVRCLWVIDLKFAESLAERYRFQLHGYRMMDGYQGARMGLLQVTRSGHVNFVPVDYDSNKTTLIASAANILRWQIAKAPIIA